MEVSVREARSKISSLLDKAEKGEEIVILRRGKRIARLVAVDSAGKHLPDLTAFRESISMTGDGLGAAVIQEREEDRY